MSKFIKLSDMLLNVRHINRILIKPDKYKIYMTERVDGFMFLGIGPVDSHDDAIEICAKKQPTDYTILANWIENCEKV